MNKYDTSIYIQMSNGSRAIISPIKEIFYLIPGILIIALFGSIFMLFSLPTFEEIQAS
jgi:TRAP-type mannitol/chloroaromatic compound transport system permease small subunit